MLKSLRGFSSETTDPNDTASDLAASGRLDGYALEFSDPQALFGDETLAGRIFGVGTSVDLFDTQESATAFLQREIEDIRRFQGSAIEGVTLKEFQEFIAPDVGTHAVAGRFIVSVFGLDLAVHLTGVRWVRGPVVATVGITALDDADQSGAIERLTLRMDQRIDDVLAGEISVTPIIPSPTPSGDAGEADPGFRFSLYQGAEVLGAPELSLSDLEGKPLVLNFWAGSLPPSRAEMPISRVPGSGVRGRGSGERETTASSLAGKHEAREKEDNGGQGKDGPAGAIAQGGNGR